MWLLSAGILFWQLLINHNMDVQYQVVGSHTTTFSVARKCEILHWLPCGQDKRVDGWAAGWMYGHLTTKNFSDG